MIVLDEQLLGRDIEVEISKWYHGKVCFITDLRPNSIIKDEAIPELLRHQQQPTFVTINEKDFWRKVKMHDSCCIVCFTLPDARTHEISQRLRSLLHLAEFDTKAKRMGNVIRVTEQEISYYTVSDKHLLIKIFSAIVFLLGMSLA